MKKLHPTQQALLELLKKHIDNPLTIRELGAEIGEESAGVIHHHLVQLERKGYLKRNPNNPRDYVLMDSPEKRVVYINKYGTAKCGPEGLMLDGNVVDRIPIDSVLLKFPSSEAFIVEARGDSMEEKIKSGDIIIAQKRTTANHGDIIVCVYQDEVLIKQLLIDKGEMTLYSLNADKKKHPPRRVDKNELRIQGVVRNILHYD